MRLFVPALIHMHTMHQKAQAIMDIHTVADILLYDLWQSPSNKGQWNTYTSSIIIWNNGIESIGWSNTQDGVMRIQGNYDATKQQWTKKIQQLIGPQLHIHFAVDYSHDRINQVTVYIKDTKDTHNTVTVMWSFYGR
jgi:hypothetical protein